MDAAADIEVITKNSNILEVDDHHMLVIEMAILAIILNQSWWFMKTMCVCVFQSNHRNLDLEGTLETNIVNVSKL